MSSLFVFNLARDTNRFSMSTDMLLLYLIMKEASAAGNARFFLKPNLSLNTARTKKAILRTYPDVVSCYLQKYATE